MNKTRPHEFYMDLAIKLAKKADPFPNPKVGAILVKNGKIIGKGFHKKAGLEHAEVIAINEAGKEAKGATLYVTLEPCSHTNKRTPPCTNAIIKSGIKTVVFAHKDPNPLVSGNDRLKKAGIVTIGPVLGNEAIKINQKYYEKMNEKTFVAIKMAMSADGKTATKTGDSKWISSYKSRPVAYMLRRNFDAIMVGAHTVINDDPHLTLHQNNKKKIDEPYRIIIDGEFNIPTKRKIFEYSDKKTIVLISAEAFRKKKEKTSEIKNAHILACGEKKIDMKNALQILTQFGIKKILIEGGSELNASALEAKIVNKLYLIVSPKLIGGRDAKPVVGGKGITKIKEATILNLKGVKRIGEDVWLEYLIKK